MSQELRAIDVLGELVPRRVLGAVLVARVGARGWSPPPFAKGRALFPKFGLPDPWDPDAPAVEIGLGDVALPERRPVAPHATPPPAPGEAPKKPLTPNVPWAPQRSEAPASPKGRPAPQIGEVRKFDPKELTPRGPTTASRPQAPAKKKEANRAFGPAAAHHAVAKLPVRPDLAPAEPVVAPSPAQVTQATGRAAPPPPRPAPTPPPTTTAAPLRPPPPPPPTVAPAAAPEVKKPPAPVNRRPPSAGGGGLDDLFGMGGGDNTRIKLPRGDDADAPRPRRPVVSSPEELAKLGLDRRPPPPKPPAVTPAPSQTTSRRDDDLPDE